ncbi:MAG: UDP-N-acetylmuramoyl-L-alanyl-D-glutamate--2,6-diaminopimelate ligase [Candidatus Omnitrophica bacterium]|nr:UDP-N-acetylmuramoyl-L-alanyl-D-glutamate--2,6-diaminopimelate ligase [Candidatus Omnitrophota bacterium]
MKLNQVLKKTPWEHIPHPYTDWDIPGIKCDSRQVQSGDLFVALIGRHLDGHKFIQQALSKGARVIILSDRKAGMYQSQGDVLFLGAPDPRPYLGMIANNFYQTSTQNIKVIGVTGTNGKTTITYLIESILRAYGQEAGLIGTIKHKIGANEFVARNTTPGVLENHHYLSLLSQQKVPYCLMEVSSHALDQGRVDQIDFDTAVYTNLTSEHLDYHADMDAYFEAKAKLFQQLSPDSFAVINKDDDYSARMLKETQAQVFTYGCHRQADFQAQDIELDVSGISFQLKTDKGLVSFRSSLFGSFNVYNILAAIAVGLIEGVSMDLIVQSIRQVEGIPGRMQRVQHDRDFFIFIDYAHTQDALRNVLENIRRVCKRRIILVFGCGGDRDRSKRAPMGTVASRLADYVYVTNDNPRTEDPEKIIRDIIPGLENDDYEIVIDRKQAIEKALCEAKKDDVLLIAGKGHETYQIVHQEYREFNESKIIQDILEKTNAPEM